MNRLKSRKFWFAVVTAAVVAFGQGLGFPEDSIRELVAVAAAYILGEGIADHGRGGTK